MSIDCCKSYVGKQIIGALPGGGGEPPQQRCFWFAEYFSAPDNTFNSWTIYGNSFDSEIGLITGNASDTLNPSASIIVFDSRLAWTFDYSSNLPDIFTALDSFGNPSTPTWQQGGCELKCWELTIPKTDLLIISIYFGIPMVNFLDCQSFYNSLFGLSIDDDTQIGQLQTLYQSLFGLQVEVTSNLDSNNDYVIRINNTYEGFSPIWNNTNLGTLYFNEVPC